MEKHKEGYIYKMCPDCHGEGRLPPKGISEGETERDVKALFPTVCESCCGAGKRFVKLETG